MGQWDGQSLQFEYVPLQDALFSIIDMCTSETETFTLKDIEEVAREALIPQVVDKDAESVKNAQTKASKLEVPDWIRHGPGEASSRSEETAIPDEEASSRD
jgi:hypothetical protein